MDGNSMASEEESTILLSTDSSSSTQSSRIEGKPPGLSKTRQNLMLLTILSLQCFSLCADLLLAPFFPIVAMNKGLSNTHVGIVFSSFELARFIASPIAGSMLGKFCPKKICVVGNIVTAIACISFGSLINVNQKYLFFALCVVTRSVAGIGSAMLTVAATSILLKSTTYKSGTIVGLIEITTGAGFAVGPVYGAALYSLVGYAPMFWILGGLMLAFLPVFIFIVPTVVADKSTNGSENFFGLAAIPGCIVMFFNSLIIKMCGAGRTTGISDWMTLQYDKSSSFVGLMFGIWTFGYIIGCIIAARLVNKGYAYQLIIIGSLLCFPPCLLSGPSSILDFIFHEQKQLWATLVGMGLIAIFSTGVYLPPLQAAFDLAHVNGYSKDSVQTYGMVTGFINSGMSLGAAVGPVLSGVTTDAFDYAWTLAATGFISLAMGLVTLTYCMYMRCTNQPMTPEENEKLEGDASPRETEEEIPPGDNVDRNQTNHVVNYGSID